MPKIDKSSGFKALKTTANIYTMMPLWTLLPLFKSTSNKYPLKVTIVLLRDSHKWKASWNLDSGCENVKMGESSHGPHVHIVRIFISQFCVHIRCVIFVNLSLELESCWCTEAKHKLVLVFWFLCSFVWVGLLESSRSVIIVFTIEGLASFPPVLLSFVLFCLPRLFKDLVVTVDHK